jgi:hypothetical protein
MGESATPARPDAPTSACDSSHASTRLRLLEMSARSGMTLDAIAAKCGFTSSASLVTSWSIDDQTLIALRLLRRTFLRDTPSN